MLSYTDDNDNSFTDVILRAESQGLSVFDDHDAGAIVDSETSTPTCFDNIESCTLLLENELEERVDNVRNQSLPMKRLTAHPTTFQSIVPIWDVNEIHEKNSESIHIDMRKEEQNNETVNLCGAIASTNEEYPCFILHCFIQTMKFQLFVTESEKMRTNTRGQEKRQPSFSRRSRYTDIVSLTRPLYSQNISL